jgi:pimeloyl-ACP methyl ester carboxylesterase
VNIKDTYINYVQYGNEEGKDIVLLHGWGQNIEMMDPIGRRLQDDFRITILDFPGFGGKSPEPPYSWTVEDYLDAIKQLLKKLKITKPIMIGHSFGGRIAFMYAATEEVSKLVLFGTPFRRTNKKASFKLKLLKLMKKIPLLNKLEGYVKKCIGSRDYRNASPIMRKILVNIINYNYLPYLEKVKTSTILIWGSEDNEVPLSEAKYIENVIPDCGLIVYEGCTHYAYLERLDQTVNILNEFLKDVK